MAEQNFDLVILGAGPGGYVAAIRAAQLGLKVAVVEANHLGGICLNWGCIPTKALLRSAEIYHYMQHAESYGLKAEKISFDIAKIVERSRGVVKQMTQGVGFLFKKNKITHFDAYGRLNGKGQIEIEKKDKSKEILTAKNIIIATGARARSLPGLEGDGKLVWTYREAMVPDVMPKSLLVIGSGAIGIEFASFYRNMGAEVTVVEVIDRILPAEDAEISGLARKAFEKQGIKIITGAKVAKLEKAANNVTVHIEAGGKTEKMTVDRVIAAVGIVPNTEDIGLDKTKIKTDRGFIQVNEWLATDEPNVYAIGDCVPGPWLAHKASHEGVICVEKIAGVKDVHPIERSNIPGCTYSMPQVASVGLTEAKAKEQGIEIKVGKFPFVGNGKAVALGETEGLVKTIFDAKTGALLGAHMIGAEVTEMIQGFVIGKTLETTEAELMHTIFAHPTISESMHESVLAAYGRAVHI